MSRTDAARQSDSARSYLDLAAATPQLHTFLELLARSLDFPVAMVNIVDQDTQYRLDSFGSATELGAVLPRANGVCGEVVRMGLPVTITDATVDNQRRMSDGTLLSQALLDVGLRAYFAVPLVGREGITVGSLCLLDPNPHLELPDAAYMNRIARVVEEQLETHRQRTRTHSERVTVDELTSAVDDGTIIPWYQPIVSLNSGTITGVEALARWHHGSGDILLPDTFISHAEESDIIIDLDLAILAKAAADMHTWLPSNPDLRLNVNISGQHFAHPDCLDLLTHTVRNAGLDPSNVTLELTETGQFAKSAFNRALLAQLRRRGFSIALDDLGNGYSSLGRLLHLPVDVVKLDREMTTALGTDAGDALVSGLVSIASALDMRVVIEGVETSEHVALARDLGCHYGQGYHWSRPIPHNRVLDLLLRS